MVTSTTRPAAFSNEIGLPGRLARSGTGVSGRRLAPSIVIIPAQSDRKLRFCRRRSRVQPLRADPNDQPDHGAQDQEDEEGIHGRGPLLNRLQEKLPENQSSPEQKQKTEPAGHAWVKQDSNQPRNLIAITVRLVVRSSDFRNSSLRATNAPRKLPCEPSASPNSAWLNPATSRGLPSRSGMLDMVPPQNPPDDTMPRVGCLTVTPSCSKLPFP